jgi:hypothetical protein
MRWTAATINFLTQAEMRRLLDAIDLLKLLTTHPPSAREGRAACVQFHPGEWQGADSADRIAGLLS